MRLDYKIILITLIIFSAIIGVLILGTDATQDETPECEQEPNREQGCGPGCSPGCGQFQQQLGSQSTN